MRVLIAGGAGFIGSHLAESHLADGDAVTIIDDLSTGRVENVPIGAVLREADLADGDEPWYESDLVYHLASPASPRDFAAHPIGILRCGSVATDYLAGRSWVEGARFVFASTSEVYGDPLVTPQSETYRGNVSSTGIRSCYDEAKRYGEALTMAWHRSMGLDTRIARIFNTYGPRMPRDGRLIPMLLDTLEHGSFPTLYGDGSQTRSFCYVADTVRGLRLLAASDDPSIHDPVNIGNDEEWSILDVFDLALADSPTPWRLEPPLPDDPYQRQPDLSRARGILGYDWTVTLPEGLERTLRDEPWYDPVPHEASRASD